MADENPMGLGAAERPVTAAEDLRDQGVVMTQVLALHPAALTVAELVQEITAGSSDFEAGDRFERAIGELCGAGLLRRVETLILPTRPALHFHALWRD
jgi:hypothetical protein